MKILIPIIKKDKRERARVGYDHHIDRSKQELNRIYYNQTMQQQTIRHLI
ncbi:hypothetical protein [Amphibacillus sediminis]|nr:hypothetical protein [Amphibacillus sediminis]